MVARLAYDAKVVEAVAHAAETGTPASRREEAQRYARDRARLLGLRLFRLRHPRREMAFRLLFRVMSAGSTARCAGSTQGHRGFRDEPPLNMDYVLVTWLVSAQRIPCRGRMGAGLALSG